MPDNRYVQIIERVFFDHYSPDASEIAFDRQEIADIAQQLGLARPKNLGDVIYSFRFRTELRRKYLRLRLPERIG
jgi:hypothetical protein